MALRISNQPRAKSQVHTRLFTADVKELKRRAREQGLPWQVLLRALVHDALARANDVA